MKEKTGCAFSGSVGTISAEVYNIISVGTTIKKRYLKQCRRHPR